MTEFISRKYGNEGYEIIIKTDSHDHYRATEEFARRLIDHAKPMRIVDKIRAMSDEELSEFIRSMVDESNSHNVACYGCINYGTHHSDPANKGTPLYECDGCENEGIGLDLLMWLQQPAEEGE